MTVPAIDQIMALGGAVRIDVEQGGCCGSAYAYSLVDGDAPLAEGDARYGCPGAWLVVSAAAQAVMPDATLDYSARLTPPRFRVTRNPNTDEVCACRRSFGSPWPGPGRPECRSYLAMPWDDDYRPPRAWLRQTGR